METITEELTVAEAARLSGCPIQTIYALISQGRVPAEWTATGWKLPPQALEILRATKRQRRPRGLKPNWPPQKPQATLRKWGRKRGRLYLNRAAVEALGVRDVVVAVDGQRITIKPAAQSGPDSRRLMARPSGGAVLLYWPLTELGEVPPGGLRLRLVPIPGGLETWVPLGWGMSFSTEVMSRSATT